MIRFIEDPNLPEGRVVKAICGEIPYEAEKLLIDRGIELLSCSENKLIDPSVSTHADMCALHLGGDIIVVDKAQNELIAQLKKHNFSVIETTEKIAGEYPSDIKLNVALFSGNAVGAFRYTESAVLDNITDYKKFDVKQGYSKCSILPINDNALITDDTSIYNALKNAFNVLLVEKGDITLVGHGYGFIGGASAKISKDEIFFFGDIRNHRSYKEISEFLFLHNCKAVYPENVPLTDVGGMVTLCEYI